MLADTEHAERQDLAWVWRRSSEKAGAGRSPPRVEAVARPTPACTPSDPGEGPHSGAAQAVVGRVDHGFGVLRPAVRIGGAISGNDDLAGAAVFAAAVGAEPGVITS